MKLNKDNMKKAIVYVLMAMMMTVSVTAWARTAKDDVMTRQSDGTYVVNTTTLCADVEGYRGTTPLKVYIKSGKVVKVEALRNQETPKYFVRVKQQMLDKWNGKKVQKAEKMQVDAVTGATFSSEAVKQNVRAALRYYQKHKK